MEIDAVINLAGEPIADKRWTAEQKQRLCHSRWDITQKLVNLFNASDTPPAVLISGSAVGFYGDLGEVVVTEDEPPHNEFTHKLCARWEQLACEAQSDRTRVCLLRTGAVLAPTGGILAKLMPLFRLGLGGPIGNGRQYLAWIHIDDMVNGILWLLDNDLSGPFNMVSPYPVRNEQFAHSLGHALNRPAIFRVPETADSPADGRVVGTGARRAAGVAPAPGGCRFWLPLVRSGRSAGRHAALVHSLREIASVSLDDYLVEPTSQRVKRARLAPP